MAIRKSKYISREALRSIGINYSNTHLLRLERAGQFPSRIYLSAGKVVWPLAEIDEWIIERDIARRNTLR